MSTINLAELNYVCLRNISQQSEEMSLLNFAISMSSTISEFVPAKKKIEHINVNIHEDSCVIEMKFGKKREVFWRISKSVEDLEGNGTRDSFVLRNMKVENRRQQKRAKYVIYSQCENDILVCQKLIELMFTVYIPNEFNIYIARKCNLSNIITFKGLNQVNNLTFIVYYQMTDQEFTLFQQKVHPKRNLVFNCHSYENQNHGCPINFNYEILELCTAKWITEEDLLRSNCEKLRIGETRLTNEIMNKLIKKWMNGEFSKLERMNIMIQNGNLDEILDGIDLKCLDEIKKEKGLENKKCEFIEDQLYVEPKFKFTGTSGRFLKRGDGKVAIVELKENKKLFFVIWNDGIVDINNS